METNLLNVGHERCGGTHVQMNLNTPNRTPEFVPIWKVKGILKQSGCPAQREIDVFQLQNTKFEHRFSIHGYDPFGSQKENRQILTAALMNQRLMHRTQSTSNLI